MKFLILCVSFLISLTVGLVGSYFFFFNDTATTEIYTLSLHDALPIYVPGVRARAAGLDQEDRDDGEDQGIARVRPAGPARDRKSTRLNSSHSQISYAVFCLKKKKLVEGPTAENHRLPPEGRCCISA